MATRGRKPSPIELKLVRGNPGKRPLNITARVLRQDEALACDRPTMLLEEAASYWDYLPLARSVTNGHRLPSPASSECR